MSLAFSLLYMVSVTWRPTFDQEMSNLCALYLSITSQLADNEPVIRITILPKYHAVLIANGVHCNNAISSDQLRG
jgi:hypothetical protein